MGFFYGILSTRSFAFGCTRTDYLWIEKTAWLLSGTPFACSRAAIFNRATAGH